MRQVLNSSVFQKYFGQSVNQVGLLLNLSWHNSVQQRLDYQLCIALESKFLHHDQDQYDQEGNQCSETACTSVCWVAVLVPLEISLMVSPLLNLKIGS